MIISRLALLFPFALSAEGCVGVTSAHNQDPTASTEPIPVEAQELVEAFEGTNNTSIFGAVCAFDMWLDSLVPQQLDTVAQAIEYVMPAAQDFLDETEHRWIAEDVERWVNLLHIAYNDIEPAELVIQSHSIGEAPVLLVDGDGESLYLGEGENRKWIGRAPQHLTLGLGGHKVTVRSEAISYHFHLNVGRTGMVVEDASVTSGLCYRVEEQDLFRIESGLRSLEQRRLEMVRAAVARLPIGDPPPAKMTCLFSLDFGSYFYCRIEIASDPAGASINIDGSEFGLTPQELFIRSGLPKFQVILSKRDYIETALEVDLDKPVAVIRATLAPLPKGP
jgi:hypothetical protein